jgi:hypothetical protein
MANRHLQRSVAMQSLYELDFSGFKPETELGVVKRNLDEFAPGLEGSISRRKSSKARSRNARRSTSLSSNARRNGRLIR